ncbi:MAG: hypothetical protein RL268_77 [Pseudomonadota bacterium]|jgi:hypothetical protein
MSNFSFDLSQAVEIKASGERGHVVGRAEYTNCINHYQVRYKSADGRATEQWWTEDALDPLVGDDKEEHV